MVPVFWKYLCHLPDDGESGSRETLVSVYPYNCNFEICSLCFVADIIAV